MMIPNGVIEEQTINTNATIVEFSNNRNKLLEISSESIASEIVEAGVKLKHKLKS